MQKILTKYWLTLHVAALLLVSWVSVFHATAEWRAILLWVSFFAVQAFLLLPSVSKGETMREARERTWGNAILDPFVYAGVALICFACIQWLNSGCALAYATDTETWRYGAPPVDWLPFSVDPFPALTTVSFLVAGVVGGGILRNGVGKASRRLFLDSASLLSGCIALFMVIMSAAEVAPFTTWGASPRACNWGTCFGFWMLVALGGHLNFLDGRFAKTLVWSFFSLLGNLLGMLRFETAPCIALFILAALLVLVYWIFFLVRQPTGAVVRIKLGLCLVIAVSVVVLASPYVFRGHPFREKIAVLSEASFYETLSHNRQLPSSLAWKIWQDHPWRGVGAGGFAHYSQTLVEEKDWGLLKACDGLLSNDGLQFLTEYGVIGAGLLSVLIVILLVSLFSRLPFMSRRLQGGSQEGEGFLTETNPYVMSGALAVVLVLVIGFLFSPFQSGAMLVSVIYVLAVIPGFLPVGAKA